MSKASRNRRRIENALRVTSTERIEDFGVNLDDRAGYQPHEVRQVLHWETASSAVHSRSLGWVPAMIVTIEHGPASSKDPVQENQTVRVILLGADSMLDVVQGMNVAMDHALLDSQAGYKLR